MMATITRVEHPPNVLKRESSESMVFPGVARTTGAPPIFVLRFVVGTTHGSSYKIELGPDEARQVVAAWRGWLDWCTGADEAVLSAAIRRINDLDEIAAFDDATAAIASAASRFHGEGSGS